MKVHVEKNLYIESDAMQFILKDYSGKVTVDDKGKETEQYKTLGYFTDIRSALNHFLKMKVMESTASTIDELVRDIQSIKSYIESVFKLELSKTLVEGVEK